MMPEENHGAPEESRPPAQPEEHHEPPHESWADQIHAAAADPAIVGTAGLLVGGVSPVAGLALGLKAAHEEQSMGQRTSLVTKLAIGRGVLGLIIGAVLLVVFLVIFFTVMSTMHHIGSPGLGGNFGVTCANAPKPPNGSGISWTCSNGVWIGTGN
jgi:hypothetical protein